MNTTATRPTPELTNEQTNALHSRELGPFTPAGWQALDAADWSGGQRETVAAALRAYVDAAPDALSKRAAVGLRAEESPEFFQIRAMLAELTPERAELIRQARAEIIDAMPALDCGHKATPSFYAPGGRFYGVLNVPIYMSGLEISQSGYAITRDDHHICFECADAMQRAEILNTTDDARVTGYTSDDGRYVTSWTGGKLMRIERMTSNARQTFVRAFDTRGRIWIGRGPAESGTYVTLRLAKGERTATETEGK